MKKRMISLLLSAAIMASVYSVPSYADTDINAVQVSEAEELSVESSSLISEESESEMETVTLSSEDETEADIMALEETDEVEVMENESNTASAAEEDITEVVEARNGIYEASDGFYYYYVDDEIDYSRNDVRKGVVNDISGWWCIQNGKVNLDFNGFARNENGCFYIENGKVIFGKNDVMKATVDGVTAWWYVKNGEVQFTDTIAKNVHGWWCIQNGKVNFSFNGLAKNQNGWFYLEGGKVIFSKNSVLKGTVDGVTAWWSVQNGQVQFTDTVAKNEYGWWCIQNGKVNFSFTGIVSNSYGNWYCKNGKVNFSYNGTVEYEGKLWSISGGKATVSINAPKLLSAENVSNGIQIKWSTVTSASGYNVYRAYAGTQAWALIATVKDGSVSSYIDKNADLAKPYVYTVRACAGDTLSSYDKRGIYGIHSADPAYQYALEIVNSVTTADMDKEARLKACYMWYKPNTGYKRSMEDPLSLPDLSWITRYAQDLFKTHEGNCYRHACSFAYIATVLGYDPTITTGIVGSNEAAHGWVEIPIGGVTYVFDEELQFQWERKGSNYNMYKVTYKTYPFKLIPKKRFKIPVS